VKIASVAEVKAHFSSYLKASAAGPVVVTRNGSAVAVLLGDRDDDELERLLLAHSRKLGAILDAADRRIDEGAGLGHDEFWQQVESSNRGREKNGRRKKRRTKGRTEAAIGAGCQWLPQSSPPRYPGRYVPRSMIQHDVNIPAGFTILDDSQREMRIAYRSASMGCQSWNQPLVRAPVRR
jgi:prevent-host-death family protein